MKRVGKRGRKANSERISWDEALDTIGDNLKRILQDCNGAKRYMCFTVPAWTAPVLPILTCVRLMSACGGFISAVTVIQLRQISAAMSYMFGGNDGSSRMISPIRKTGGDVWQ